LCLVFGFFYKFVQKERLAMRKSPRVGRIAATSGGGAVMDEDAKERMKELEAKVAALEGKLEGSEYQRNQLNDDLELCREDLESAQDKVEICENETKMLY
jgi:septal ring factor EnvC (AmiA/AmiB activator)